MHRLTRLSMLSIALLALGAPVAHADHAAFDCGFDTVSQETVTGGQDTFTGVAYGFVASTTAGENVSIRCYVRVDGSEVSSTATGAGVQAATTTGQVTYTASDTQAVDLCAEWTAGWESGVACGRATTTQIPPQEVIDLLNEVAEATAIVDPLLCPLLAAAAPGLPGVAEINGEGDVFVIGDKVWDCPPYESGDPGGGGSPPTVSADEVSYNDGETGFVLQTEVEELGAFADGPTDAHDLASSCTYKVARQTGLITVIGKTKAGRHPTASTVSIRCRLVDQVTGIVLYDQTRVEPGTMARLNDTVAANPNAVTVCNRGEGWWGGDGHNVAVGLTCK